MNPQKLLVALVIVVAGGLSPAADVPLKTKNVILVTTDGFRWQEVFSGVDDTLVKKTDALGKKYWRETPEERRKLLLPFLWGEVASHGQIFGNQTKGSVAHVTNGLKFSYPGYNEIFTGHADPRINSNDKVKNPNVNVLEWLNGQPAFQGRVAAFANWDVFPFILNVSRSHLPVWTGMKITEESKDHPQQRLIEELARDATPTWSDCTLDTFTYHAALNALRETKPRVFYVGFEETDEWAHEGRYSNYLYAAHNVDRFIQSLWETAQALPEYRDTTTILITTDHGRGNGKLWTDHNEKTDGAENIWIAVMGPDTPALGERENVAPVTQSQIAATLAKLLGQDYRAAIPEAAEPLAEVFPPRSK